MDRSELEICWEKIILTLESFGAKPVAAYTHFEHLDGPKPEGAAVVEFASMELVRSWYDSLSRDPTASSAWSQMHWNPYGRRCAAATSSHATDDR